MPFMLSLRSSTRAAFSPRSEVALQETAQQADLYVAQGIDVWIPELDRFLEERVVVENALFARYAENGLLR